MYDGYKYEENLHRRRKKNRKKEESEKDVKNNDDDVFDIWKVLPSFQDINENQEKAKLLFLLGIEMFFICITYAVFENLSIAIGLGVFILVFFIIVFHDSAFELRHFFMYNFRKFSSFNPFEDLVFWQRKEDPTAVFFSNKEELTTMGVRIFEVGVIPENIHVSTFKFLQSLNGKNIRTHFSYQIVQTPLISAKGKAFSMKDRQQKIKSEGSFKTSIFFSTFYYVSGILNESKLEELSSRLDRNTRILKSGFTGNFYHYQMNLLSGQKLINALRLFFFKDESSYLPEQEENISYLKKNLTISLVRIILCCFIVIYTSIILIILSFSLLIIFLINSFIIGVIIGLWWRGIFFSLTKNQITSDKNNKIIDPFKNFTFYRFRKIPDSIFILINNEILINTKIFNLKYVTPPLGCNPDKLFRTIMTHKIPFTYTLCAAPISFDIFEEEGLEVLNEKTIYSNWFQNLNSGVEAEKWLMLQGGIWRTIITMSVSSYKFASSLKISELSELEEDLENKAKTLFDAFNMNYLNYDLVSLKDRTLTSGFQFTALKNKFYRVGGTHLNYLLFQGRTLKDLTKIVDELKKGVETKIAAEFNTPTQLENYITVGHTINTEILEQEIPAGFTLDQLDNLLIVSGTTQDREALLMKIVLELVKGDIPSIIFDYSGQWSKIIKHFEGSRYEDDFLYFKLGTAFNLNMFRSDIPYDKNNIDYLNYVFDVYALTFKENTRNMEVFKNTILKSPELDLSFRNLEMQNLQSWEKNPAVDSMVSLLSNFTQQAINFLHSPQSQENAITINDFIQDDKTVIIDLSIFKDLDQKVFGALIIISKLIHYLDTSGDFIEKFIFIPNIDKLFDRKYLDMNVKYNKIDKFLEPLREKNFGLILTANHIQYLHPNLFNFVDNYVSFKATDTKDLAVLKQQLKLQELHGTGYYSASRNHSYQIDYLMNMRGGEVLFKRDDWHQPFPVEVKVDKIYKMAPMNYGGIIRYMHNQGYDLQNTEEELIRQSRETLFEINLGDYIVFLKEIVILLDSLRKIDQVGNIYKTKIKKELKDIMYNTASKVTKNKKKITEMRDKLFDLLVRHGYLVESHPPQAAGNQAIRTSYSVGTQYERALKDYFELKRKTPTEVKRDIVQKETIKPDTLMDSFIEKKKKEIDIKKELEFKTRLIELTGKSLLHNLYKMKSCINEGNYGAALNQQYKTLETFLYNLHSKHREYKKDKGITDKDLEDSISYLVKNNKIPFSKDEIRELFERSKLENYNNEQIEGAVNENYGMLMEFYSRINKKIAES